MLCFNCVLFIANLARLISSFHRLATRHGHCVVGATFQPAAIVRMKGICVRTSADKNF